MAGRRKSPSSGGRGQPAMPQSSSSSRNARMPLDRDGQDTTDDSTQVRRGGLSTSAGLAASRYSNGARHTIAPPLRPAPRPPRVGGGYLGLAHSPQAGIHGERSRPDRGNGRDNASHDRRRAQSSVLGHASRGRAIRGGAQSSQALRDRTNSASTSFGEQTSAAQDPDSKYLALRAEDFVISNSLPVRVNEPAPWQPLSELTLDLRSSSGSVPGQTIKMPKGRPIWEVGWHEDTIPVNGIIPQSALKDPKSRPPLEVLGTPVQSSPEMTNHHAQQVPLIPHKSRQRRPIWEQHFPDQSTATESGKGRLSSTRPTRPPFNPSSRAPNQAAKALPAPEDFGPMSSRDKVAFEMKYQVWSNFVLDIGECHHGLSKTLIDQIGRSGCLNRSWPPLCAPKGSLEDLVVKVGACEKAGSTDSTMASDPVSESASGIDRTEPPTSLQQLASGPPLSTRDTKPDKALTAITQPARAFETDITLARLATSDVPRLGASTRPARAVTYASMADSIYAPRDIPAQEIPIGSTLAGDKHVAWAAAMNATKSLRRDVRSERQRQNRKGIIAMRQSKSSSVSPGIASNLQAAAKALTGLGVSKYAKAGAFDVDVDVSSATTRGEMKSQANTGTLTPTQETWKSRAGSQQGHARVNAERASRAYREGTAALRACGVNLTAEFISSGGLEDDNDDTPRVGSPRSSSPSIDDAAFWDQPIESCASAGADEIGEPSEGYAAVAADDQQDIENLRTNVNPTTITNSPQTSGTASATASLVMGSKCTRPEQPAENRNIALHLPPSSVDRALNITSQSTPRHPSATPASSKRVTRLLGLSSGTTSSASSSITSALKSALSSVPSQAASDQNSPATTSRPSQSRPRAQRRFAKQSSRPPVLDSSHLSSSEPSTRPLRTIAEGAMSAAAVQPDIPSSPAPEVNSKFEPPLEMPELPSHNLAISIDGTGFPDHSSKPYLPKDFPVNYQISNGALYSMDDKAAFENAAGRTIVMFNLPIGFTAAEVVSMVWGGPLEAVFMLPDKDYVSVIFLHVADCDRYAMTLPECGIPYPGQPERMIKCMRRGEHDPHHPDLASWARAGATRCLRITSIPCLVTVENMLHLLQGRWKEKEQAFERPLEWMLARSGADLCSHVLFDFCQEGSFLKSQQWMVSVRFIELRHALDAIWLIHCVPEWTGVMEMGYIQVDFLEDVTASSSERPRNPDYFGRHEKVFPVPAVYGYIPAGFDMSVAVEVCDVPQHGDSEAEYTAEDIESLAPVWPGDTHAPGERALMHGYVMLANRRDAGYVGIEDQKVPDDCAERLARGRGASI